MPPATNVSSQLFTPPLLDAPPEPGPPGSYQRQAWHLQRACQMHLAELESRQQTIARLQRKIDRLQRQIAHQRAASYDPHR